MYALVLLLLLSPSSWALSAGHPYGCIAKLGIKDIYLLETLPGQGWDNLQNEDRNMIIDHQYHECRTTSDQKFLIPDSLTVYPTKTSQLHSFTESMEHWDNYSSITDRSINIEPKLSIPGTGFTISGKFSHGYEKMKRKQSQGKTTALRSQARFSKYKTKVESINKLSDSFRKRVSTIGEHLLLNQTDLATYESQLLVREYGTHVVTGVELGAMIVQVDYLDLAFLSLSSENKKKVIIGAEVNFNGNTSASFGFSFSNTNTDANFNEYKKYVESVEIQTFGGQEYSTYKSSEGLQTSWIESINNNQVGIDKEGDPIFHFINEYTLPHMPSAIIFKTYESVKDAVASYYKHNIYAGCTNRDSPDFDYHANVDDGTCSSPSKSFVFGGVYQTCTMHAAPNNCKGIDLCITAAQNNPLTGGFSCEDDYEPILMKKGEISDSCTVTTEYSCGFLWLYTCFKYDTFETIAAYSTYWCAAKSSANPSRGMLFGGTFTSYFENPITQSSSCPEPFYPLKIANDLSVCVSTDTEIGSKNSVPFAGFHSCISENPYTENKNYCPADYSQHLSAVVDGCQIDVCVKIGAISITAMPHIQMPPYIERPEKTSASGVEENFAFDEHTNEWKNEYDMLQQNITTQSTAASKSSPNVVSMILLIISCHAGSFKGFM